MNTLKKKKGYKKQVQSSLLLPDFSNYEEKTGEEYHTYLRNARQFYYEEYKEADLLKYVWSWMEENGYSKKDIKAAQKAVGVVCYVNIAINCKLMLDGMPVYYEAYANYWNDLKGTSSDLRPLNEVIDEFLLETIRKGNEILSMEKNEKESEKNAQPPQKDTSLEVVRVAAEPIEKWLSDFNEKGWDLKSFDFRTYFESNKLTMTQVKQLASLYQDECDQFKELVNMPSQNELNEMSEEKSDYFKQLKEGYSNLTKPQINLYYNALCRIITECDLFVNTKKVTQTNKKITPKSSDELIKNLKYKSNDTMFDLTSIKPQMIVGSNELWVFNSKTRKLGCYVASNINNNGMKRPGFGLSVKGSTIIDFDTEKSVQRTVRKPAEVLKRFMLAHKNKKHGVLEELTTMETKLNGRINTDIVLLYVK